MKITNLTTDAAVLEEVGRRIAEARLARRTTQAQFAQTMGVSKRTIERLEDGAPTQLSNFIRCLRALGKLDGLERLLPETAPNPIGLLERRGAARQRARPKARPAPDAARWKWGEDR